MSSPTRETTFAHKSLTSISSAEEITRPEKEYMFCMEENARRGRTDTKAN